MIFKEYDLINQRDISSKAFNDLKKFASYEENYKYIDMEYNNYNLEIDNNYYIGFEFRF